VPMEKAGGHLPQPGDGRNVTYIEKQDAQAI